MIELSNIHKTYKMGEIEVPALRGVSLRIEPGEFVAIMGTSGSGKSTLMHIAGLLDVPQSGSYKLFGQEVSRLSEDALAHVRGKVMGFVFQQFHLLARTPATENVSLPLLYTGNGHNGDEALAKTLLTEVGLGSRMTHKPNELSGGQQQRVAIARALVNSPRILFADEPTGNLDSASKKEIMEIFSKLNSRGITVVIVTHEPEIAEYTHRVVWMRDGQIQSDERKTKAMVPVPSSNAGTVLTAYAEGALSVRELAAHFKQAVRSITANKVRAALSMLGILIGVAAVVSVLALGAGAKQSLEAQLASMGSNLLVLRGGSSRVGGVSLEAGAVTRFTMEDAQAILAGVPSIKKAAASVSGRAQLVYGNKNWSTQVQGTMPEYASMRASVPVMGRFFTAEEERQRTRVVVIGMTVLRELFGEANPIGETIKINRVSFQVIGVLPEKGATGWRDQDDVILVPLSTAMRRLLGKDYVDSIDLEVRSSEEIDTAQEDIKELIMRRHRLQPSQDDSFQIRNMAEIQETLTQTSRTMSVLLSSIAAISLLVGGIGIMNIMLVSVTERTREIGLRKAVGARRRDILSQFLIEAVVISGAGGVLGILLGATVALSMSQLAGWTVSVSPASVLLAFTFSAGVGVLFGFWPARQASLLNPIEALRYE